MTLGAFFVSVYHYQAGRERGGPPTPVHPLWKCPATTWKPTPVHPFSGKTWATPIHRRNADPCLFPEKLIPEKWVALIRAYII